MARVDPFNGMAIGCVVIAAIIEAAQQALTGAPKVMGALPTFMTSPNVNYLPLLLLITAGVLWVIKHLRADLPATQPLIKEEETGFTPSGGGLFTPTVTQSEPRRHPN